MKTNFWLNLKSKRSPRGVDLSVFAYMWECPHCHRIQGPLMHLTKWVECRDCHEEYRAERIYHEQELT